VGSKNALEIGNVVQVERVFATTRVEGWFALVRFGKDDLLRAVNETAALVFFQNAFGRKHLQTAETNVRTMPIFAAMGDQSTQVLYVYVVMLSRVVED